jgi:DNA adenine methylase
MKTPITYYGGKQMMLPHILPLIPKHLVYTESFVGGGAVFWAKEPVKIEVINDKNYELCNFYEILKSDYSALFKLILSTIHARDTHKLAITINQNPYIFTKVQRAWATWCLSRQGFSGKLNGSWGYDKTTNSTCKTIAVWKENLNEYYSKRLENVQIENNCATKIIESRDTEEAFHYCDPPYFNSHCGHYAGYSENDFKTLLEVLRVVKGKFMLSSYPSDVLSEYTQENAWNTLNVSKKVAVSSKTNKEKIEVITMNY